LNNPRTGEGPTQATTGAEPESPRGLPVSSEQAWFLHVLARSHLGGPFVSPCFEPRTPRDREVRDVPGASVHPVLPWLSKGRPI
jgi:hypothetical protein